MKLPQLSPRIWLAICAFLVSLVAVLAVGLARKSHHHGGKAKVVPLKLGKMSRLDLPAEQRKQVRQMFKEHRRSHRVVARSLRKAERQLQRALVDPATTDDQLKALFAEITAQQDALQQSRFMFTLRLRQLIGPENMRPLYRHLDDDDDHDDDDDDGRHGRRGR